MAETDKQHSEWYCYVW